MSEHTIKKPLIAVADMPQDLKQLLNEPAINKSMPITFANKRQLSNVVGRCKRCGCAVDGDNLRGRIANLGNVVAVKALSICHDCKVITPVNYRIYDDMSVMVQNEKGFWERLVFIQGDSWMKKIIDLLLFRY